MPRNLSLVINVTSVLVQGLYLRELPWKPAVTMSMVVARMALVLEVRINKMVYEDVHRVPSVSL